jgi:putative Ca2+/H+ antiporter (TMEM165/GDT1 family)
MRNGIVPSSSQAFVLVKLLLLSVMISLVESGAATKDWFQLADTNHDGVIDRTEYDEILDKFMAELEDMSPIRRKAADSSSSFFSFLWDWSSFSAGSEGGGYWKAFTSSLCMILATEIGDKTFFIAAVLSMKHDRMSVFAGAIAALILMTVLSTALGLVLPKFLDRKYTHLLSGILFLYFGIKLVLDSRSMEAGHHSEELEEVEQELLQQSSKKKGEKKEVLPLTTTTTTSVPSSGNIVNSNHGTTTKSTTAVAASAFKNSVLLTALSLTFVAEWGDRSQIATIALASAKNPVGVTIGGILGHCICTASAVLGGRMLASNISEKTVSQWGGIVFLIFGIHSIFWEE